MIESAVRWALTAVGVYLGVGLFFGVAFQAWGIARVDPGSRGAGPFFRTLITPGIAALWPFLAWRWRDVLRGRETAGFPGIPLSPRRLRALHGLLVKTLAVGVPVVAGAGLALRPEAHPIYDKLPQLPGATAALGGVERELDDLFPDLHVAARIRSDGKRRQLELDCPSLDRPALALYWCPSPPEKAVPANGVLLGLVWGPAVARFDLPPEAAYGRGTFLLYSLTDSEVVSAGVNGGDLLARRPW